MFTGKLTFTMHISIKNLGIVQSAEIELNGLTVLTGHNDTGKSFIGKLIFSIINTIHESPRFDSEYRRNRVTRRLRSIEELYRTILPFNPERRQRYLSVSNSLINKTSEFISFHQDEWENKDAEYKEMKDDIELELKGFLDLYQLTLEMDFIESKNEITQSEEVLEANKIKIEESFNGIRKEIFEGVDNETKFKNYFNSVIVSDMFQGQINSLFNDTSVEIKLIQGSSILLTLVIENNVATKFNYKNQIFQTDATIIETPTIIQLDKYFFRSALRSARYKLETFRNELPLHYMDLLSKFSDTQDVSPIPVINYPEVFQEIPSIIGGEVVFTEDEKTISFSKNDKTIASSNIATGIKSFGILQLLLKSGNINDNSFLIIDEPEVHLHPHWEIEYARLIVLLSKAGVPIIISTHSPYFIKALTVYAKKYEIVDKINVLFGEKEKDKSFSTFTDITNNLQPFLETLSEPMQKLFLEN